MATPNTSRYLTLTGYFGTLLILTAWYCWLAPSVLLPRTVVLLLLVAPMLAPLKGLLEGRPYTYAWSGFLALFYFAHGTVEAWSNSATRPYAIAEVVFTIIWFCSSIVYVRQSRKMPEDTVKQ